MATRTDRLADELRSRICAGRWKVGEALPSFRTLALEFKVGMNTVRHAMARLAEEGLVDPVRGVGAVVRDKDAGGFRGVVLFITAGRSFNYHAAVVMAEVEERLSCEGFVIAHARTPEVRPGKLDFSLLDIQYALNPVMVIVVSRLGAVREYVARKGVPYVLVGADVPRDPACAGRVVTRFDRALEGLAGWIRETGVRRILEVGFGERSSVLRPLLSGDGVSVRQICVPHDDSYQPMENVTRPAMAQFEGFLRKCRKMPDLICVTDDFVAQGVFAVLQAHRIAVPADVRMVLFANRGNVFPLPTGIPVVESDPYALGAAIARTVCRVLSGEGRYLETTVDVQWRTPSGE